MLIIKGLIGASIVIVMTILSKTKYYFIAGLIPLFPTFALIAHVIVGKDGPIHLKETALFGIFSLIPYFVYLLSVYTLAGKYLLYKNLIISVILWFIFAVGIYLMWKYFKF